MGYRLLLENTVERRIQYVIKSIDNNALMCLNIIKGGIMNTSNITNYKPKEFAELLGVSVKTLQRWDREGTLTANRTPTNRRYYTYKQYLEFKGITEDDTRKVILYARVSTKIKKMIYKTKPHFYVSFAMQEA